MYNTSIHFGQVSYQNKTETLEDWNITTGKYKSMNTLTSYNNYIEILKIHRQNTVLTINMYNEKSN